MNRTARHVAFGLLLISGSLNAALVGDGNPRRITSMNSYPELGGGDVTVYLDVPVSSACYGLWLRPTDPGFKQSLAVITAARFTNTPVKVWAFDDQVWSGSSPGAVFCRAYVINA